MPTHASGQVPQLLPSARTGYPAGWLHAGVSAPASELGSPSGFILGQRLINLCRGNSQYRDFQAWWHCGQVSQETGSETLGNPKGTYCKPWGGSSMVVPGHDPWWLCLVLTQLGGNLGGKHRPLPISLGRLPRVRQRAGAAPWPLLALSERMAILPDHISAPPCRTTLSDGRGVP